MQDKQTDNKTIAKNTLFLYIRMAIVMLISIYSSRVILQSLGVIDYGIYNVVAGFIAMFSFLNSSLTASIQRFLNYKKAQDGIKGVQEVFNVSLVTQLLLAIIFVILLESIGLWYINNKMVIPEERLDAAVVLFHLTVISTVVVIVEVSFSAIVISYERMNVYAYISVLNAVLRLGAALCVPLFGADRLVVYGAMLLCISALDAVIYFVYVRVNFKDVFVAFHFDKSLFKEMMSFSGWNMFGAFSFIVKDQGVNMILNLFFGPVVNAARGVSMQISAGLKNFVPGVYTAARPQLVEAYANNNNNRVCNIFFSSSKLCFLILYLVALPVACEVDFVLRVWLGENVPRFTNVFTVLILMSSLVDILNTPVSMVVLATGKVRNFNIASSIIGLSVIPASYILLKMGLDPQSVYVCVFVVTCLVQLSSLIILERVAGIKLIDYARCIIVPLLLVVGASVPIGLACICLMEPSFLRFVVTTVMTMGVTGFVSYRFAMNQNERNLVISAVNKIIRKRK